MYTHEKYSLSYGKWGKPYILYISASNLCIFMGLRMTYHLMPFGQFWSVRSGIETVIRHSTEALFSWFSLESIGFLLHLEWIGDINTVGPVIATHRAQVQVSMWLTSTHILQSPRYSAMQIARNEEWLAEREAELKQIKLEVVEGRYDTRNPEKIGVVASRVLAELMAEMVDRPEPVVFHEPRMMPTKASRCHGTISGTDYTVGLFHSGEAIAWICRDGVWAELYRMQHARASDAERLAHVARLVVGLTPEERGRQTTIYGEKCGVTGKGVLYRLRDTIWVVTPDGKGYFHGFAE